MTSLRYLLLVAAAFVFLFGGATAQDPKKDAPVKVRGQLPPNWGKLGLSEEQKQKIYTIQSENKAKIDGLKAQIKELEQKEKSEVAKVLTDDQKKRLREIVTGDLPTDDKKPVEKKPDEKKPTDKKPDGK